MLNIPFSFSIERWFVIALVSFCCYFSFCSLLCPLIARSGYSSGNGGVGLGTCTSHHGDDDDDDDDVSDDRDDDDDDDGAFKCFLKYH